MGRASQGAGEGGQIAGARTRPRPDVRAARGTGRPRSRQPAGRAGAPSVYSQVPMSAMAVPICVCVVSLLPKNSTAGRGAAAGAEVEA